MRMVGEKQNETADPMESLRANGYCGNLLWQSSLTLSHSVRFDEGAGAPDEGAFRSTLHPIDPPVAIKSDPFTFMNFYPR